MKIGITERGDGGLQINRVLQALENKEVDGAIIITKFPHLLLNKDIPSNTIIHCTITGHGGTYIEPGVEPCDYMLVAYKTLVEQYGADRVVLRVDPIIPTMNGLNVAMRILNKCLGRARISFMDLYSHVRQRFQVTAIYSQLLRAYGDKLQVHVPLEVRREYLDILLDTIDDKPNVSLEVCGEPGMSCVGCVSSIDLTAMGLKIPEKLKEAFIRPGCHCLAMKQELLSKKGQCAARCIYCYWK